MSKNEEEIADAIKLYGLDAHKNETDSNLAKYCGDLARLNLTGRGEPHPLAIDYVVRTIIDAGRIMGAAQTMRREDAKKAAEEKEVLEFVNKYRVQNNPEGIKN